MTDFVTAQGRRLELRDLSDITIDLPPEPRDFDSSSSALFAALVRAEGRAMIGLKAPSSPRPFDSGGERGAIQTTTLRDALTRLEELGVEIRRYLSNSGVAVVTIPDGLEAVARVLADPHVGFIDPSIHSFQVTGFRTPISSPLVAPIRRTQSVEWGMDVTRVSDAWTYEDGSGSPGVNWMIVDTGYDNGHEDLASLNAGDQCRGPEDGCDDDHGHGTHVSGIASARDNSLGVIGAAHGLDASRIFSYGACDSSGNCDDEDVADGIDYAVWPYIHILSMSLGGPYDAGIATAIASAWSNGVVLIASAGNDDGNQVVYPAGHSNVVGVSGVLPDSTFASTSPCIIDFSPLTYASSNYGSHVDISAPFYATSTVPGDDYEGYADGWCGTSMSVPYVSATAVLILKANSGYDNEDIVDELLDSAHDLGSAGRDDYFGYGLLDALEAVQ